MRVIVITVSEFNKDKCGEKASALTYFSLISFVPVLAMAFGIAQSFGLDNYLEKELQNYCYKPTLKIVDYIKSLNIPVICFPKGIGKNYINFNSIVKPNCISIDYEVDPKWIKEKLKGTPIQGGLDPKILLTDRDNIKKNTENYIKTFSDYPYVFNLGHGVLPETKPETIEYLIKIIREKK